MESPWNSFCGPWTWNTTSCIFPECFSSTPLKLYYCRWSGWWSTLSMYVIGLTSFAVYICRWMPRILTASAAVWGATGQRHFLLNKDAWIHYQGMGVIFQGPQTGISGMLFQLTSTLQCPPHSCRNPPESTGMGLESTGIGLESAGIHRNGTSKVQHSSYSPNGIW